MSMSLTPQEVQIAMRDGTKIGAAIYAPMGGGRYPALLAASPYRYDNNALPASPQFLWRETGPVELYVERGYAYVHMDVRGSGKSGGEFEFLGPNEQQDLHEVIEWIARQPWSNGKVGGIGQSYYCMSQWLMAVMAPPALACIAAYDGLNDPYRASVYQGGIPGEFFSGYWWSQNRIINRYPANGATARLQETDLGRLFAEHPTYDDFWRSRCAWERLDRVTLPVYSIGQWGKIDLHTRGNLEGYRKVRGPKKLRINGAPNAWAAAQEFASVAFHEQILLPFYDCYLKGAATDYALRPPVEYFVRGAEAFRSATSWPPAGIRYETWYLCQGPSRSVTSLNDGALSLALPKGAPTTNYEYPNGGWVAGVVGYGPAGPAGGFDPVRRVLTFTSPPLERDIEIAGPMKLLLYAASTCIDTDFFVKLSDQLPQAPEERAHSINPAAVLVSKGWLRASHRAVDPERSTDHEPYQSHARAESLVTGHTYRFEIGIEPMAYRFKRGHRIRLEIANGDSPVTDMMWHHIYAPSKIGRDTIYHTTLYPSSLILPVLGGQ